MSDYLEYMIETRAGENGREIGTITPRGREARTAIGMPPDVTWHVEANAIDTPGLRALTKIVRTMINDMPPDLPHKFVLPVSAELLRDRSHR